MDTLQLQWHRLLFELPLSYRHWTHLSLLLLRQTHVYRRTLKDLLGPYPDEPGVLVFADDIGRDPVFGFELHGDVRSFGLVSGGFNELHHPDLVCVDFLCDIAVGVG